jgi:hypothetical protein
LGNLESDKDSPLATGPLTRRGWRSGARLRAKEFAVYAVKAGGNGVLNDSALAWKSNEREVSSDVPTPLFYDGDFFILSDGRKIFPAWSRRTGT